MTRTRFLWLFITLIMSVGAFAQSPEPEVLVFGDKFSETASSTPVVRPILPKAQRLSKDAGKHDKQMGVDAPNAFERYRSLVCLDQPGASMHYAISQGDKNMQMDQSTTTIPNAIERNIDEQNIIEIVGEGIGDNGLASAYEPHSFSVKCNSPGSLSNALWTYKLPLNDGTYETVVQKNNVLSIEIPAVVNPDDYEIDSNGCIPGEISFTGILGGKEVSARYKVFLTLKPKIKNVTITDKISNAPFATYDIHYTVEYVGCDELLVTVEEEHGYSLTSWIKEPFMAHIQSKLKRDCYSMIEILASNEYGTDEYYIKLEPFDENNDNTQNSSIDCIFNDINATADVYDMFGRVLKRHIPVGELEHLGKGVYVLQITDVNGVVRSIKYVKR